MYRSQKTKRLLIVFDRFIRILFSVIVIGFFLKTFLKGHFEIKGGPTYFLIGLLIFISCANIFQLFSDLLVVKASSWPWEEEFLRIDLNRDKKLVTEAGKEKRAIFLLLPGYLILGTLLYSTGNKFFLLVLVLHFYLSIRIIMRTLKLKIISIED